MSIASKSVLPLLEYVKIDTFSIVCHFKCTQTNKSIVSIVPFEPFDGKIEFTWQELLLHPLRSYRRYYHTPIIIYASDMHETIVLKAFQKVADKFRWNAQKQIYIYH